MSFENIFSKLEELIKKSGNSELIKTFEDSINSVLESEEDLNKAEDQKPKSSWSEWEPRADYTEQHHARMKPFIDKGYHPREAEFLAGAHKGPQNLLSAMDSRMKPTPPSNQMLDDLKGLAGVWLKQHKDRELIEAEPEKNPEKHARGQMIGAVKEAYGDYNKAYKGFKDGEHFKNLDEDGQADAIDSFNKEWHGKNIGSEEQAKLADTGRVLKESKEIRHQHVKDVLNHMLGAHSGTGMDFDTAAQMAGGTRGGDDEKFQIGTVTDPAVAYAQKHSASLKQIQSSMAPSKPKVESVVKEHGTPEQQKRTEFLSSIKSPVIIRRKGTQKND